MPAVSQAQRGFLASKFGPEWMREHHFDNPGKLPQYAHGQFGLTNVNPGLNLFRMKLGINPKMKMPRAREQ